jgi:glycerol-3-phosphate dehydrogenase
LFHQQNTFISFLFSFFSVRFINHQNIKADMNREKQIQNIRRNKSWDIIIVGGGATGLGIAVDSATRGYKTLLLEKGDFSQGTSSRSTKLVHGGVRYLQQGNISLVLEALKERGLLIKNAPHLVKNLSFVVPNYDWWEGPFYGIGMKVYDMLAGDLGIAPSEWLSKEETIERIPTVEPEGLRGGVIYYDGQFDDARLAITLAQTAIDQGGTVLNYCPVIEIIKEKNLTTGVIAQDIESGEKFNLKSKVVINATGIFTDDIRKMDDEKSKPITVPSQGVHIVLDKSFLPGDSAIMVPHTDDGRVLFAVPWHDCVIVGTTDTPINKVDVEPVPLQEEIDFLITHAARYLTKDPRPKDVLSVFAGIRPLVKSSDDADTAALSRDHSIFISRSGLLTIAGGKWTTYRKMAEDTVNEAATLGELQSQACITEGLNLHGFKSAIDTDKHLHIYGTDKSKIEEIIKENPAYAEKLLQELPYIKAEIIWAVRIDMARTLLDVLSRRTRALILNAKASLEMAPAVVKLMSQELNKNTDWEKEQLNYYTEIAKNYLVEN